MADRNAHPRSPRYRSTRPRDAHIRRDPLAALGLATLLEMEPPQLSGAYRLKDGLMIPVRLFSAAERQTTPRLN